MIHAIILAGGWGRRFWPKSRKRLPKQLLCLGASSSPVQSLFNTIKSQIPKKRIWVVANKEHAASLRRQLPGLPKRNLLLEPEAKNTAAAIGWASLVIKQIDPQAVTLVLSSDQILGQKSRFLRAIKAASMFAKEGNDLVVVGIRPYRAAEEFGYLKIRQKTKGKRQNKKIYKVEKFVEKPSIKKAKAYLRSKNYLWNGGIFVWKATSILGAIKKHLPGLDSGLQRIKKAKGESFYKSQLVKEYKKFKDISIDYGVLEKAGNIYTVVGDFSLQDLGSWDNFAQGIFSQDKQGNVICGPHRGVDTCDSVILSEKEHLIGTVGVRDLIIVHTADATLVCKKDRAQDIKKLTRILEKDKQLKKYL